MSLVIKNLPANAGDIREVSFLINLGVLAGVAS